jgi:protein gp37
MHPEWARSLRDQCAAAGVPFFFKQWGEWLPGEANRGQFAARPMHAYRRCDDHSFDWPAASAVQNFGTDPDCWSGDPTARRVGKKAAGRKLDGVEHNVFPERTR